MGINGLISYLSIKVPHVIRPTPSLNSFGGKRIFIDCSIILRRSLHAALRTVLDQQKQYYRAASNDCGNFIDVKYLRQKILTYAVNPLLVLNKSIKSIDEKGGIEATFVLGPLDEHSLNNSKSYSDPYYINILDVKNKELYRNVKDYLDGNETLKFYPSLTQKDISDISQKLIDQFAKVQIRNPEIAKKCVEFCTKEDDYVLSDDTNVLAYGAPNVIRDYFGSKEPNTINHKEMLDSLELSRDQFIDFCILLGYKDNVRIPEIGPDRAYNIIKRYKSLDIFLNSTLYQRLFQSKKAVELLSKHNMGLGEFTDKYFNLELRDELRSSNTFTQ